MSIKETQLGLLKRGEIAIVSIKKSREVQEIAVNLLPKIHFRFYQTH